MRRDKWRTFNGKVKKEGGNINVKSHSIWIWATESILKRVFFLSHFLVCYSSQSVSGFPLNQSVFNSGRVFFNSEKKKKTADCERAVIWLSHSRVCHIPGDGLHRCHHVLSHVTATVSGYTVVGNPVWAVSSPQLSLALFSLKLPHLICAAGGLFKLRQIFKTGFLRGFIKMTYILPNTDCVFVWKWR